MVKELKFYQDTAHGMIEADEHRIPMLLAMDRMWHVDWEEPDKLFKMRWVQKVTSTDPHDALRAGMRVLSTVEPKIRLQPLGLTQEEREKMDRIERALVWHLMGASRRHRSSILSDITLSAFLYDEIIAQVIYLPHQIEALKVFKGDTKRLERAKRFGPFSVVIRNPKDVSVKYSEYMAEEVLMRRTIRLHEAVSFWGKNADKLKKLIKKRKNKDMEWVTIFEFMSLDAKVVWGVPAGSADDIPTHAEPQDKNAAIIQKEDNELPFLPWIARAGGSNLFPGEERVPLLYSVFRSGQWNLQNIIESLVTSEAVGYAAAPRLKIEGPTDEVDVDYGEPGRPAYVPPGHQLTEMQPPIFDQGLQLIADRVSSRMAKSTIPNVLTTGEFPSGTAFATANLVTQSGLKALAPYKELSEEALADIFVQMLNWIEFAGDDAGEVAFVSTPQQQVGEDGAPEIVKQTEQIVIRPGEVDVENLHRTLTVELTADVPTDRMARINAGSMAVQNLNYSRKRALEQSGTADPEQVFKESAAERDALQEETLRQQTKQIQVIGDVQREEAIKNAQTQQQIQTILQPQGQANGAGEEGAAARQQAFAAQQRDRDQLADGEGFSPPQGGSSSNEANPEGLLRESRTGVSRTGEEIA